MRFKILKTMFIILSILALLLTGIILFTDNNSDIEVTKIITFDVPSDESVGAIIVFKPNSETGYASSWLSTSSLAISLDDKNSKKVFVTASIPVIVDSGEHFIDYEIIFVSTGIVEKETMTIRT